MQKLFLFITGLIFVTGCFKPNSIPSNFVSFTNAAPPVQPTDGPGGNNYSSEFTLDHFGSDEYECWTFIPNASSLVSTEFPVIIFMHGWSAMYPDLYDGWIKQLVKKGSIVIFPRYQKDSYTPLKNMTNISKTTIMDALKRLKDKNIKTTNNSILIGHSIGGFIAANLATINENEFPKASGLFLANACDGVTNGNGPLNLPINDLTKIPTNCIIIITIGDQDALATKTNAFRVLKNIKQIPDNLKSFLFIHSDQHGTPVIKADHAAPTSAVKNNPNSFNSIDYYCYWKLADALVDTVYYNKNKDYVLGGGQNETYMGKWSDGIDFLPLTVMDLPK